MIFVQRGRASVPMLLFRCPLCDLCLQRFRQWPGVSRELQFDVAENLRRSSALSIRNLGALTNQARRANLLKWEEYNCQIFGGQVVIQIRAKLDVESRVVHTNQPVRGPESGGDEPVHQR